jgi:thymidylate synthase
MTISVIEESSAKDAWRAGCSLLLKSQGELNNLMTVIDHPCQIDEAWLEEYSPATYKGEGDRARDVANTLFPQKTWERATDRTDFYRNYLRAHDRVHRWQRGRHAWGTYFERLVRFPSSGVNQLERCIEKLNTWPQRSTTGLVFHLSSPAIDAPKTRGGPCWQFAEILWGTEDVLDLVVTYRNHDFFNKVLGNFIGLGRLLEFICTESGKQPGKLICHSVHAYYDSSQHQLRSLIK